MKMNSKIILDRRADQNGQPVVAIYGIIIGDDFGMPNDGKRRAVAADTVIIPIPGRRYVDPGKDGGSLGSPEDIMEHHLNFSDWAQESTSGKVIGPGAHDGRTAQ
jgi:hypothetical protein